MDGTMNKNFLERCAECRNYFPRRRMSFCWSCKGFLCKNDAFDHAKAPPGSPADQEKDQIARLVAGSIFGSMPR
jgi:ribosomal protein L37AE/L43A